MAEREWIHPARELVHQVKNAATFTPEKLPSIMGNHVCCAHSIPTTSTRASPTSRRAPSRSPKGSGCRPATSSASVGHTGNSTAPHLHFQLMDSPDLMTAKGIACAFRAYEVLCDGEWVRVENGVPGRRERIRSVDPATG